MENNSKIILAFVGMPGAGKSEATKYLFKKGFPFVRFGKLTEEVIKEANLPITTENERIFREKLRKEFGMEAFAVKAKPKLDELVKQHDFIAIDGLYSWEEYVYLKKCFNFLKLIVVYSEPKVRYERLSKRKVRPVALKDAYERDVREIEMLNKGGPIAIADFCIINNSNNLNKLYKNIDNVLVIRSKNMIHIKTQKEIETMKKGGKILADVMWEILSFMKPGVSELEIDALAEKLILEKGGEPGFKKVEGYKHTICVSTNDVCVHGIPGGYKFKEGDVVGIDNGVYLDGFHTDMSETIIVGQKRDEKVVKFLKIGKDALDEGIKQAQIGNRVGHISRTIQKIVEFDNGYSVVKSLVGHGVGHDLHEDPEVPGFLMEKLEKTPLLKEGMVIAVEVIYNMGKPDLILDNDGWTLKTRDGSLSGLFERTIAITKDGPLVLTR